MTPTVSIIIPAYQTADLIGETLESVARQTRGDFEAIIIDDGSTDALAAACAPFLTDERFALYHFDNGGLATARNRGIELARGEYIALVDADDHMEPTYLEDMLSAIEAAPDADIVCCDATMFGVRDRDGRRLSEFEPMDTEPTLMNVLANRFLIYVGATMRTQAMRAVGGFTPGMQAAEDFDLWVRMLARGSRIIHVPKALARYRRRAGSLSNSPTKMHIGRAQAYLRALGLMGARPREAALCRRKLGEILGLMDFYEGERALLRGDITIARAHFHEAARQGVLSPKWRVLRMLLGIAPGVAKRAVRRRHDRLPPIARLSAGPAAA